MMKPIKLILTIIITIAFLAESTGVGYALRPPAERCSGFFQTSPEISSKQMSEDEHSVQKKPSRAKKKKNNILNINRLNLETLKRHLSSLDSLKDLDASTIDKLAKWIIEYRPYRNRKLLKKALQGTGIKGVKKHHQEAIAESFKVKITRRKFFTVLAIGAVAVFSAAKILTDSTSPVPKRDWTKVRNKIKTEKLELNQRLTQQFLAVYPDERDFIEQINNNEDIVFADYVAEIFGSLMNSSKKDWRSHIVVDELRSSPQLVVGTSFTPEALRYVKRTVSNNRMPTLVEKIMQFSNINQPEKGLNDFAKMAIDCTALNSATQALYFIDLGKKKEG